MHRYFLELAYKGTNYSGFQVQQNANTIQAEVEKALGVLLGKQVSLTGSSRTDTGVHALQNFFHFDTDIHIAQKSIYNLNAILPADIAAKNIYAVSNESHCRFNAISRQYRYFVYKEKNPFLRQTAYYFPYTLNLEMLQQAALLLMQHTDFTSFSKRSTQVKNFNCIITNSVWSVEDGCLVYNITGNRFLRGMVRGLVATMLKAARGLLTLEQVSEILVARDSQYADFSAPPQGLFLVNVNYPNGILLPIQP